MFFLGYFYKSFNFDKNRMWDMIYSENLILRTMAFEYFYNSRYFERYGHLFRKLNT